jgi:hypothetical protein
MFVSPNIPDRIYPETNGKHSNLDFLSQDEWLINTEVRYHLRERRSQWFLTMVFVAVENPMKFICRPIDVYQSEQKALTFAKILQRGIRKDARGTQKSNLDGFNICSS